MVWAQGHVGTTEHPNFEQSKHGNIQIFLRFQPWQMIRHQ